MYFPCKRQAADLRRKCFFVINHQKYRKIENVHRVLSNSDLIENPQKDIDYVYNSGQFQTSN